MKNLLLLLVGAIITLASCTKPEAEIITKTVTVTNTVTETITVEVEIEVTPEVLPHGYPFSLTQFGDRRISNVVVLKEIAGSQLYQKLDYRERGELDGFIEQGYVALENNSCCLDSANFIVVVGFWEEGSDHGKETFNFIITK